MAVPFSQGPQVVGNPAAQTPMMRQFLEAKDAHPDSIVFFRMGDFYETFFDDAVDAARILELTLTSRNKKDAVPIAMAGVPHHAARGYIRRLLAAGRKVAICEQVEDPRKAKGIVKREVVRVVTPGVVLDEEALEAKNANYLVAIWRGSNESAVTALAWADVSTGELKGAIYQDTLSALEALGRIEPSEALIESESSELHNELRTAFPELLISESVAADGGDDMLDRAVSMLSGYLARTQGTQRAPLAEIRKTSDQDVMGLGTTAIRNLELLRCSADSKRRGSLLHLLDRTHTAMGARLLKQWMLYPLRDVSRINARQNAVAAFVEAPSLRAEIHDGLDGVRDLERLMTRVLSNIATPRDIGALADSLGRIPALKKTLETTELPSLVSLAECLDPVEELAGAIREAVVEEPPPTLKDGGVFREGYHADLDGWIGIARDGKAWFTEYAESLRAETEIPSLKIRYNQVFGYFIEVTKANLHRVPDTFLRKQTLANAERYYTPELKEYEEKVLSAQDRRVSLETSLFDSLRTQVATYAERVRHTAQGLAAIDVLAALADVAHRNRFVCPEIHGGTEIVLEAARHPVIESLMPAGEFVPNDIQVNTQSEQLLIITGPNMSGKSTIMRQVALISIMAQMGGFVPATSARLGIVDQVFTRVGASDHLTRGQSTFMVEMVETSEILSRATDRSLIIIDEIGRGTSTYDGVSIAWAVAEYIHDHVGARTLFATHYHELTELASIKERAVNMSVSVKEWQEEILFVRRLVPGGCSRSYGIQVARLAGMEAEVVERAKKILANLERGAIDASSFPRLAKGERAEPQSWQMSLFAPPPVPSQVHERLKAIDPDAVSPREALSLLYELRTLLDESE